MRPVQDDDDPIVRAEIVHQAWEEAYHHIFTRREIASVFDGSVEMQGEWTGRRTDRAGTLVAETGGDVVGLADLALLLGGDGELAALFVLPRYQGRGVGTSLWKASLDHLRELGIRRMEVWTLAGSAATRFYERRGCRYFADSLLHIGSHVAPATGYEISP